MGIDERRSGTLGEHPHLRVATDVAPKGDEQVVTAMRDAADSVPVIRTRPTGITETDSLAMATQANQTAFFANPVPSMIQNVIGALEDGTVPTDGADAVVDHEPGTMTLPVPDAGRSQSAGDRFSVGVDGPIHWLRLSGRPSRRSGLPRR